MSNLSRKRYYHRNLPHDVPPGATFFVTFRLADSVSPGGVSRLRNDAQKRYARCDKEESLALRKRARELEQRRTFGRWDVALAEGYGECHLRNPKIAAILVDSLEHWNEKRYDLLAYTIMPNHAHILFTPLETERGGYYTLGHIMQSLKGYTARMANRALNRSGSFWQHESYDRWVRNDAELERIVAYILENPVNARLVQEWNEWPWSYCKWMAP